MPVVLQTGNRWLGETPVEELHLCSVGRLETAFTSLENRWVFKGIGLGSSHEFETQLCNDE